MLRLMHDLSANLSRLGRMGGAKLIAAYREVKEWYIYWRGGLEIIFMLLMIGILAGWIIYLKTR